MKKDRRSETRTLTISVLLFSMLAITLSTTRFFRWIVEPLVVEDKLVAADAIVIFGGGLTREGQLGKSTEERVRYAATLVDRGFADRVVISGGYRVAPNFDEAEMMAAMLNQQGITDDCILLDRKARNTYENALHAYKLCRDRGFTRVILVTSPYHMRRAVACFRRHPMAVVAAPVPNSEIYAATVVSRIRAWDLILHEYGGLLSYRWKGWI